MPVLVKNEKPVVLTDKMIAILQYYCEDKTTKEIASILGLSPRTIESYRDKIKEHFGADSLAATVFRAMKEGVLPRTIVLASSMN